MTSIFGTFTSQQDIQRAVLNTLRLWILTYLAETERQESLPPRTITPPAGEWPTASLASYPPTASGFRTSLDFEPWQGEELPLLIVVCQPFGDAERYGEGQYAQWYELQVAAVVQDAEQETAAQLLADRYGKALMGLLSQQGALGTRVDENGTTIPFAEKTVLKLAPRTELVDVNNRRFARAVVTIHSLVETVVDESQGPRVPPVDPYALPGVGPTITQVDITLQSQTAAGVADPADGVTVTTPVGAGAVVISE